MTLEEMKESKKEILTPCDIASLLGCDPCSIRAQAEKDVHSFEFPVCKIASRVKIPKRAFIAWFEKSGLQDKHKCSVCEAVESRLTKMFLFNDEYFCGKHYNQIIKNGKITDNAQFSKKEKNIYVERDNHAEVTVYSFSGDEQGTFIIDLEDVSRCKQHSWCISFTESGYASVKDSFSKISLHRFLLSYDGDLQIDHINRNPLDNRKANLRIVRSVENNANKEACNIQQSKNGKYKCLFVRYGVQFYLGYFDTEEEAKNAKKKKLAEIEESKEFYIKQYEEKTKEKTTGVSYTPSGRWKAYCFLNGKMKAIGTYDSAAEAKAAREKYIKSLEQ